MLIHEGGLIKALKKEYRAAGYTVFNTEEQTIVYAQHKWSIRTDRSIFPRRALAIIVEHMGIIPPVGEPTFIKKDAEPQTVMTDVIGGDLQSMEGEITHTCSYCPIVMQGLQVYQEEGGGACWGVSASKLGILELEPALHMEAKVNDANFLIWETEKERVLLYGLRTAGSSWAKDRERAVWEALERIDLHKEEET